MDIKNHHTIILGDSRRMEEIADESVHLVITSPPYWQLKDYGTGNQIGFKDTYEEYINHLNLVWNECYRILHPGCRLCINIGDQFARSVYYGRYKIIPIRTEIIKFCESIGFDYMGAIIWQKVTTCNTTGGATVMGSFPYPRNGIVKLDYEFILLFKKLGKPPKTEKWRKEQSKLATTEWNEYFDGHWNFSGEKQEAHLAQFPEELPKRLIRMFSFAGDTVMDPFLGSGTTSLAAKHWNRNSIGYEINHQYIPIIEKKLGMNPPNLFEDLTTFEIIKQPEKRIDYKSEIAKLPYVFHDPVKFDKKIDPRTLSFGSKIDGKEEQRSTFYSIKHIVAPDKVELSKGLKVRLLGVKPIKIKTEEAIAFIRNLTKGQKVFMKFDEKKYDQEDNLLAYLYLKNKTFINLHLIKNSLAMVDASLDFKEKDNFVRNYNARVVTSKGVVA